MADLPKADRQKIANAIMRYWSKFFEPIDGLTKSDIKDAVDATDDYIDDNQIDYNNALPTAAKTNMTTAQKTLLFCVVSAYRISEDFCKKLIGRGD